MFCLQLVNFLLMCLFHVGQLISVEFVHLWNSKLAMLNTVNSEILRGFYFRKTHRRSFPKIKSSRNGKISMSFTDEGKSCHSCKFLMSQICFLTLFAKINFSRKFPDLQYYYVVTLPQFVSC